MTTHLANSLSRDGKLLCVAPLEPKFWQAFSEALDRPITPDKDALSDLFASREREHWVELLRGTCVSPALSVEEVFEEAHFRARGCFEAVLGLDMVRTPFGGPALVKVPNLGQDTERILSELDIPLNDLLKAGIAATTSD